MIIPAEIMAGTHQEGIQVETQEEILVINRVRNLMIIP